MKKLMIAAAVVVMALAAVSCKKTCNCTTTQTMAGVQNPQVVTTEMTINKGKCSDLNTTQTVRNGGMEMTQVMECK